MGLIKNHACKSHLPCLRLKTTPILNILYSQKYIYYISTLKSTLFLMGNDSILLPFFLVERVLDFEIEVQNIFLRLGYLYNRLVFNEGIRIKSQKDL